LILQRPALGINPRSRAYCSPSLAACNSLLRVPDRFAAGIRSIPGCALGGNRLAGVCAVKETTGVSMKPPTSRPPRGRVRD